MIYLLVFINIVLLVLGQAIWKFGAKTIKLSFSFNGMKSFILNPYILGGGIVYIVATFLWIYILSKEDLSRVYPMQSLCYILGAIVGVMIFNETISSLKIIGLMLIICGAFLLSVS